MTPPKSLELQGTFQKNPPAELILEIAGAGLNGALRITARHKKAILYLRSGEVVYGVSNARSHRLFSILLEKKKLSQAVLAKYPNFAADLEFASALQQNGFLSGDELQLIVLEQIEAVISDSIAWTDGEWTFSPLARAREDLSYPIELSRLLTSYARGAQPRSVFQSFKSIDETFHAPPHCPGQEILERQERQVLSRFREGPQKLGEILGTAGIAENETLKILYTLWLGGFLLRPDRYPILSGVKIESILGARVSLVKEAARPQQAEAAPFADSAEQETMLEKAPAIPLPDLQLTLEEYLTQVEQAETFYDILSVDDGADITAIKQAYFARAKMFHPDRFHRNEPEKLRRIQSAFTELAQAYETLKSPESRENYDFKIRKNLDARERLRAEGHEVDDSRENRAAEQGLRSFELGLSMLADEEYETAVSHLARAIHYSPNNALYHAYYGKALSADPKHRHKADAELQTAVKLDPKNGKVRMMLVEFLIELNMTKRAEGELRRFLEIVPDNPEARKMLDDLTSGKP